MRRNEIVHQDWLLRGGDAMRTVATLGVIDATDLPAYLEEWSGSPRRRRLATGAARNREVVSAKTLEQRRRVEREIAAATVLVSELIFRVASSRETGGPPGCIHPV